MLTPPGGKYPGRGASARPRPARRMTPEAIPGGGWNGMSSDDPDPIRGDAPRQRPPARARGPDDDPHRRRRPRPPARQPPDRQGYSSAAAVLLPYGGNRHAIWGASSPPWPSPARYPGSRGSPAKSRVSRRSRAVRRLNMPQEADPDHRPAPEGGDPVAAPRVHREAAAELDRAGVERRLPGDVERVGGGDADGEDDVRLRRRVERGRRGSRRGRRRRRGPRRRGRRTRRPWRGATARSVRWRWRRAARGRPR